MSFQNLYYKRTAGTAKACYVCYRPTETVLATIGTTDFIYTCPGHLTDSNFASRVNGNNGNVARVEVPPEEIAKVKAEWEAKQKEKEKDKETASQAEKEESAEGKKVNEKGEQGGRERERKGEGSNSLVGGPSTCTELAPTHEQYTLHRDFFAMRQAEHRKRRQATEARELVPRLPGAPRGSIGQAGV